jgi:NAD(P)-dependent dehydrogenase (short-subunit alcohol dehydrogenase family)
MSESVGNGRPGRRALVTGASSGIGQVIAEHLVGQGWRVTGMSRTAPKIAHADLSFVGADLDDGPTLAQIAASLPAFDAFVHAAGFMRVGTLEDLDVADGQAMWRVHVDAATMLAKHLVPAMPAGGRIVLIGSRTSAGAAGRSQYAATKAALIGLARSWALELTTRGITVNVVSPGATATPMLDDPARKGVAPHLPPIGRFIYPEEIAALVIFLLSNMAAPITGQEIVMCGGASL